MTWSTSLPSPARRAMSASYSSEPEIAAWKIEGFVVTPTTLRVASSSARLPVCRRLRERSSSQMETPASERAWVERSEEHTSELQSRENLVCRLLLEKKNKKENNRIQA